MIYAPLVLKLMIQVTFRLSGRIKVFIFKFRMLQAKKDPVICGSTCCAFATNMYLINYIYSRIRI